MSLGMADADAGDIGNEVSARGHDTPRAVEANGRAWPSICRRVPLGFGHDLGRGQTVRGVPA